MNKSTAIVIYLTLVMILVCSLYHSVIGIETSGDLLSNNIKIEVKKKMIKEGDVETWVYWVE